MVAGGGGQGRTRSIPLGNFADTPAPGRGARTIARPLLAPLPGGRETAGSLPGVVASTLNPRLLFDPPGSGKKEGKIALGRRCCEKLLLKMSEN